MRTTDEIRDQLAAKIKDAYYAARDNGGTMHTAADDAAHALMPILADVWDAGSRAGWSDRTKSFMEARSYEQEIALQTRNPYREGGPA